MARAAPSVPHFATRARLRSDNCEAAPLARPDGHGHSSFSAPAWHAARFLNRRYRGAALRHILFRCHPMDDTVAPDHVDVSSRAFLAGCGIVAAALLAIG